MEFALFNRSWTQPI